MQQIVHNPPAFVNHHLSRWLHTCGAAVYVINCQPLMCVVFYNEFCPSVSVSIKQTRLNCLISLPERHCEVNCVTFVWPAASYFLEMHELCQHCHHNKGANKLSSLNVRLLI